MIEKKDLFHIGYYDYGQAFSGSHRGMRYRLARNPLVRVRSKKENEQADCRLLVFTWPEPFAFDKTSEEEIEKKEFPYTEEGLDAACDWLNEVYEKRFKKEGDLT